MRRVFVSVPFLGRSESDIRADMEEVMRDYTEANKGISIFFVNNYDGITLDDIKMAEASAQPNLWYLSLALQKMSRCDDAIFSKNWEEARGCKVEKLAYDLYFNKS